MEQYPLRQFSIYLVKKDFTSDYGYENADLFSKGQQIQFQEKISDIYGMMEIIRFKDIATGTTLTWRTRVENLYDNWKEYLMKSEDENQKSL